MRKSPVLSRRRSQGARPSPGRSLLWIPVLLATASAFIGFRALTPAAGSLLVSHVALRYTQRGPLETCQSHPALAVFSDYRSLDLALLALLLLAAALVPAGEERVRRTFSPGRFLAAWAGPFLTWGVGSACLWGGANFLDYEGLKLPFPPPDIRPLGAALAFLGVAWAALFLFLRRRGEGEL